MSKKLLAIFAHPDDEAFGPGGTLAYYASKGVEVHLLCATKGEGGEDTSIKYKVSSIKKDKNLNIGKVREKELLKSAEVLGIKSVEFLGFTDGTLCNAIYHQMADKIIAKINKFKPQIVLTVERRGVSGHLDHIATSMITTYSYLKTNIANKLYYHCLPNKIYDERMQVYFVYFPEGYSESEITTRIDYSPVWEKKVGAMTAHKSQLKDVRTLLNRFQKYPKADHFILQYHRGIKVKLPETDLFTGISV